MPYKDSCYPEYDDMFEEMLADALAEAGVNYVDLFVERNSIKAGVSDKDSSFFYHDDDPSTAIPLNLVSDIRIELQMEVDSMPAMYIFMLPEQGRMLSRETIDEVMKILAQKHYERIVAMIRALPQVVEN